MPDTHDEFVVFWSWQNDLENPPNRTLILTALQRAVKKLGRLHDRVIRIEQDTTGIAGSPNITQTILNRIAKCDVFVCDVTTVHRTQRKRSSGKIRRRYSPNPNVMLELGYAMANLEDDQIICVMNEAYGKIERLPFDVKLRRVSVYYSAEEDVDRTSARQKLERIFVDSIGARLSQASKQTSSDIQASIMEPVLWRVTSFNPSEPPGDVIKFWYRVGIRISNRGSEATAFETARIMRGDKVMAELWPHEHQSVRTLSGIHSATAYHPDLPLYRQAENQVVHPGHVVKWTMYFMGNPWFGPDLVSYTASQQEISLGNEPFSVELLPVKGKIVRSEAFDKLSLQGRA